MRRFSQKQLSGEKAGVVCRLATVAILMNCWSRDDDQDLELQEM